MAKNNTSFRKGFDSRRFVPINDGLMEYHSKLGALLRKQSLDAITLIVDTMNDEKASLKLRLTAANNILDRGLGRAVDRTVIATLENTEQVDVATLDTAALENLVNKLAKEDKDNGIIEGEFIESE